MVVVLAIDYYKILFQKMLKDKGKGKEKGMINNINHAMGNEENAAGKILT